MEIKKEDIHSFLKKEGISKSNFSYKGNVPSPTYTLIEPYEFERGKIFHIDLYRINDQSELEFLGWNDLFEDGGRTTLLSLVPLGPIAPGSLPPWPGSITTIIFLP